MAETTFGGQQSLDGGAVSDQVKRAAKAGVPAFQKLLRDSRRKPPEKLGYLLNWYNDLRAQQVRGAYVEPVSLSEIDAFGRLYDLELTPWEVDVLCRLDRVWLSCVPKPGET